MIEDIYSSASSASSSSASLPLTASSNTDQMNPVPHSFSGLPGLPGIPGEVPPLPMTPFITLPQKPSTPNRYQALEKWMQERVAYHRNRIGLDAAWCIECSITPGHLAKCEGSVTWDQEVKYAVITLRSDLTEQMASYVLVHELFELLHWETADIFVSTLRYVSSEDLSGYLMGQYRAARNRLMEIHTTNYLHQQRPGHLFVDHELIELSPIPSTNTDAFRLRMSAQMHSLHRSE